MIFIFNVAPHYNYELYDLFDKSFDCDFYFGDKLNYNIKLFDYQKLSNFRGCVKNVYLYKEFYWQKGVVSILLSKHDDYIITGDPYCLSNWLILIYNGLCKRRTYVWTHGLYGKETKVKRFLKLLFYQLSTGVLLYGQRGREILLNFGLPSIKLNVVFNSTNYFDQIQFRGKSTDFRLFANEYPVLLFVGRLTKRKKIDMLYMAFEILNKSGIYCNLLIVGDDDEQIVPQIEVNSSLAGRLVKKDGCFSEDLLAEYFHMADLFVVPGDIGLAAVHSLTYGIPVITHDNFENHGPEFEAIIPDRTGDFYKFDSVIHLTEVISKWFTILQANKEIVRSNCYNVVDQNFNPEAQLQLFKKILL